jgi:dephospho-CoA kinase
MLKVGLTGSIAVGKSYVCEVLRGLGADVLDADQTSREVVAKGTGGLARIVEEFGTGVLAPDGALDRAKLGAVVFADEEKRLKLNSIVHPLVMEAQDAWLRERESRNPQGIAFVDAALMIESGGYKRFDRLVVVWCDEDVQKERLMKRNGLTEDEAVKRIRSQMPQEEKKAYADFLIETTDGFEAARERTEEVFATLKELAG